MTIALVQTEAGDFDIALDENGFIVNEGAELFTAVAISLFTRRYDEDTRGPNGWWADGITGEPQGSRLHLLEHAKASTSTLRFGQLHTYEALEWATRDGVAREVIVTAEYPTAQAIAITTEILSSFGRRWRHVWKVLVAAV